MLNCLDSDADAWRDQLLDEVEDFMFGTSDEAISAFDASPAHVRHSVFAEGPEPRFHVPLIRRLADVFQFPQVESLIHDYTQGFSILGDIIGSPWWRSTDPTPAEPWSTEEALKFNQEFMREEIRKRGEVQEFEVLLSELLDERELGRVVGPLQCPSTWGATAVGIPSHLRRLASDAQPMPEDYAGVFGFPIAQTDELGNSKVRRGDDWKAAGLNAATCTRSSPSHADVTEHVVGARWQLVGPGVQRDHLEPAEEDIGQKLIFGARWVAGARPAAFCHPLPHHPPVPASYMPDIMAANGVEKPPLPQQFVWAFTEGAAVVAVNYHPIILGQPYTGQLGWMCQCLMSVV